MNKKKTPCPDLGPITKRIREKRASYASYNFTPAQNDLLRTFFDLAQEFDSNEDYYRVCVAAPFEFLGVQSRLYIYDDQHDRLQLVCDSEHGLITPPQGCPAGIKLTCKCYEHNGSILVPIHRKPQEQRQANHERSINRLVMGVLEVYPLSRLAKEDRFFLRKFSNRIGYNLHNRMIAQENIRHLKFINSLVQDIEHNVITPNMYFKHLFNQLKKRIKDIDELEGMIMQLKESMAIPSKGCEMVMGKVSNLHQELLSNHRELLEHHANYSLFLESLFRRDHFAKGRFVLQPKRCSIESEIVTPQLDHYLSRFKARNITVERPTNMHEEELFLRVDVGLLSQVYANLFSNAVKYSTKVLDHKGRSRKAVAYGQERIDDFFGPGLAGIKFNVFTTGPHLDVPQGKSVFIEGVRASTDKKQPGTGHGLAFVKQVIEIHDGVVGYEATEEGNNFYFVLPLPDEDDDESGA